MDVLSDVSSVLVEFKATKSRSKHCEVAEIGTSTTPPCDHKDASVETTTRVSTSTQFPLVTAASTTCDEHKLAQWLRGIAPMVEAELLKGPTPILPNNNDNNKKSALFELTRVQKYQKISIKGCAENSQGLATWLSVYTNNAPVLVVTTVAPHDDWCNHINQSLKLLLPKRLYSGNFVVYTEIKSISLKSCLKSLCTNPFDKSVFAGASMSGDIYVWRYVHDTNEHNIDLKELFCTTSTQSAPIAIEWPTNKRLLVCFSNGLLQQWIMGSEMQKEHEYSLNKFIHPNAEITSLLCLTLNDFVFGTSDGCVYRCWYDSVTHGMQKDLHVSMYHRHPFMVTTLLKVNFEGLPLVLSCDLSGEICYQDVRNVDELTTQKTFKIPLPFKSSVACAQDGSIIYCPSYDGALECYCVEDGSASIIKGALRGKGNFIKFSDNGCWIITGLYHDEFQLFCIEN